MLNYGWLKCSTLVLSSQFSHIIDHHRWKINHVGIPFFVDEYVLYRHEQYNMDFLPALRAVVWKPKILKEHSLQVVFSDII